MCGNTIACVGVLPHTIILQWRMKICLVCFVFPIYAGRAFCEPSMWCYFHMLLGRALTIKRFDELCDCKSVTPTIDRSTAEAFLLICPLCLLSKPKKHQPYLRLPGWRRLGLWQYGGHDSFLGLTTILVWRYLGRF
jgi:hypothetical protein